MSDSIELKTVGFDSRFPQQNQTKHCYQSYIDYHKCITVKGEDFQPCKVFWKAYNSLCPSTWTEDWDAQIQNGTFPGNIKP